MVAYADGCTGDGCVQGSATTTGNSYTAVAAIARQTGGRRLFAGNDPAEPTIPGAPLLTVGRDGSVAHLTWSESDNGASAITNYAIFRGTASGNEAFLANAGTANSYNDITADPNTNYYYTVTATNGLGTSCGSNEVLSKPIGDSQCTGLREVGDPAGDQKSAPANADLDVLEVRLADYVDTGNKILFKLKVSDLSVLQPNRQWRIIWNYPIRAANIAAADFTGTYYVGMNTDASSVPSFEYGTVTTVESVPANTSTPHRIGDADSGTIDQTTGIISVVLSTDKIGGPVAGDVIGALIGRTFAGNGNDTVLSSSSVDTTSKGIQDPYTGNSYRLVGNTPCSVATPTPHRHRRLLRHRPQHHRLHQHRHRRLHQRRHQHRRLRQHRRQRLHRHRRQRQPFHQRQPLRRHRRRHQRLHPLQRPRLPRRQRHPRLQHQRRRRRSSSVRPFIP